MDPADVILLLAGGLVAGTVNTMAGGGSLLTVPLLVMAGVPGNVANGSNRVGILASNTMAAVSFRRLGMSGVSRMLPVLLPVVAGSLTGSILVSRLADETFERAFGILMVPLLLLALRPPKVPRAAEGPPSWPMSVTAMVFFLVGCYGGAFQAGIGLLLVLALSRSGLDLVVANGHVDDLQKLNQPYRMRPQFYRNVGGGRFVELPARGLGDYFARELLGRGLARADLDRDGREDFVVSHLEQPASLLYNRTQKRGGWLAVRLVATSTAREAIGARVTVADGEWRRVHFLTAGDGYMASNQRQLVIGLGARKRVKSLLVEWPSGESTKFTDVAAGGELVIVEGQTRAIRLPSAGH